jgi:uncharacterized coiled-coil protein SlyX
MSMDGPDLVDLEIKLAYQERRLGELDALVRALADRVVAAERELVAIKRAIAPEALNEPPPHY